MPIYERDPDSHIATNVIWAIVVLVIAGLIFYGATHTNFFKVAPDHKVDVEVTVPAR